MTATRTSFTSQSPAWMAASFHGTFSQITEPARRRAAQLGELPAEHDVPDRTRHERHHDGDGDGDGQVVHVTHGILLDCVAPVEV
jgi:hypothetical protein